MVRIRLQLAFWLLVAFAGMSVGCTPATLAMLMRPFYDDVAPPECPIAKKGKEVTVAIVCRFNGQEDRPEIMPAEQELAEYLQKILKKRYQDNKEKVAIIPPSRVRPYLARKGSDAASMHELGKELKADYVISLEITQFALTDNSLRTLYRGTAEIDVKALDISKDAGEATVYTNIYKREYPRGRHIDAGEMSMLQFRHAFELSVANDIAKFFATHPDEERFQMD